VAVSLTTAAIGTPWRPGYRSGRNGAVPAAAPTHSFCLRYARTAPGSAVSESAQRIPFERSRSIDPLFLAEVRCRARSG
jgi:hypothetical protein